MTLRQYFFIMITATVLCWVSWAFVLVQVDPFDGALISFFFFYLSLFLALVGTLSTLLFFCLYVLFRSTKPLFRMVQQSFQQGFLVAFFGVLLLFLYGQRFLRWWSAVALILLCVLVIATRYTYTRYQAKEHFSL